MAKEEKGMPTASSEWRTQNLNYGECCKRHLNTKAKKMERPMSKDR